MLSPDFEVEQDEMSRAVPPVYLTRELWVCSNSHIKLQFTNVCSALN